jgi:hypothetical protein
MPKEPDTKRQRRLVRRATAIEILDTSLSTLKALEKAGKLTPIRIGKRDVHYQAAADAARARRQRTRRRRTRAGVGRASGGAHRMSPPTAAAIMKALERHKFQNDVSMLADLDDAHHDAVRQALSGIAPRSRIDVRLLVADVRRYVSEAEAARRANPNLRGIFEYGLSVMDDAGLARLRDELRRRREGGEGGAPFLSGAPGFGSVPGSVFPSWGTQPPAGPQTLPASRVDSLRCVADAEPDPDPDDESDTPRRRRGVARYVPLALSRAAKPRPAPAPQPYFGPTLFHNGVRVGGTAHSFRPPWVLSDDSETETDDARNYA